MPRLAVHNQVSDADRRNYLRSLELIKQGIEQAGFATVELPTHQEMMDAPMVDSTHQMGVVRMGDDPRTSVCDSDLRVWSSPNLYLASSGVFPTAGQAGPTLTIVAFATRLADHLANQLAGHKGKSAA